MPAQLERFWEALPRPVKDGAKGAWASWAMLTAGSRLLPDYLIVGAQRGGTTSLYKSLVRHPSVGHALTKELRYFDLNFERGERWYRSRFPSERHAATVARRTGVPFVVGEASPDYLFCPHAPRRAAGLVPDAKLILLLRDPVERAHSHYWHQIKQGHEQLTFEDALRAEPERLAGELERMLADETYVSSRWYRYSYVARGVYVDQLGQWFERFPKDRILILRSEDFFEDPGSVFDEVLRFLGLPPWRPAAFETLNKMAEGSIPPELRLGLAERFRPHNRRLAEMLGRDFGWDR